MPDFDALEDALGVAKKAAEEALKAVLGDDIVVVINAANDSVAFGSKIEPHSADLLSKSLRASASEAEEAYELPL